MHNIYKKLERRFRIMLIYNVKLNKKAIFKTSLAIMLIICIGIGFAALYKVLNSFE